MAANVWDSELLQGIWQERMTLCYKMLLIREMLDAADENGRAELRSIAERFQCFFRERKRLGKAEENPNRFKEGESRLSERNLSEWERVVLQEPIAHLGRNLILQNGQQLFWDSNRWADWSRGFKQALRNTAEVRLIEYFEKYVPGGF